MANSAKNIDNKLIAPAKRYADAILEIAKSKNELDKFHEDIKTVCDAYDSSEEFKNFMNHPIIPASEKKDAVKNIFDGKIAPDVLNLVYILVERNKFSLIDTILYCFEKGLDEAKNILRVEVISAVEVDEDLKENLKNKLENRLNKSVLLEYSINPEIIAGMILKIQDKTIDGSMARKLENLQRKLA